MLVVGVDGCRYGWVAVILNLDGGYEVELFRTFGELWQALSDAVQILVDIPIGLKEQGPEGRRCDTKARKILGPRKSSVFPVPCRSAVYQSDYDAAIKENLRHTGKSIFKAVWQIVPKIREVDELLGKAPSARHIIRESHPEVCFLAFNGGRPMAYNKKRAAGAAERQKVLEEILYPLFPQTEQLFAAGKSLKKQEVASDDFLDGLGLAVTARLGQNHRLATIPAAPDRDARGLPMEMVYIDLKCSGASKGGGTTS